MHGLLCQIFDDFVITDTSMAMAIKEFKKEIMKEWEMTDEGILFWCLNLRVTRDRQRGLLKIDQTQYVDEILRRFNMRECNPRKTPLDANTEWSSDMSPIFDETSGYEETFPYASALGSLLYLRLTRPDIMVAVNSLVKFMKNPLKQHWNDIKQIFRYLQGTKECGLMYCKTVMNIAGPWKITMWVDSDYVTEPDTRR